MSFANIEHCVKNCIEFHGILYPPSSEEIGIERREGNRTVQRSGGKIRRRSSYVCICILLVKNARLSFPSSTFFSRSCSRTRKECKCCRVIYNFQFHGSVGAARRVFEPRSVSERKIGNGADLGFRGRTLRPEAANGC